MGVYTKFTSLVLRSLSTAFQKHSNFPDPSMFVSTAGLCFGRYSHTTKKTSQTPAAYKSPLPFWHVTKSFLECTLVWSEFICHMLAVRYVSTKKEVFGHPQNVACLDLHSECLSIGLWAHLKCLFAAWQLSC